MGTISQIGESVKGFKIGDRVGVPWLGGSCEKCFYCLRGEENLCDQPVNTGYTMNGGFAEYCVADADYIFLLPPNILIFKWLHCCVEGSSDIELIK